MSDNKSVKRKRNRFKVVCLKCGSIFNNYFKKQHEEKVHNGKSVNIKLVGAPDNPFQSAAKTSKIIEKRNLVSTYYKLLLLLSSTIVVDCSYY